MRGRDKKFLAMQQEKISVSGVSFFVKVMLKAVVQRCFTNKVLLKFSQNSQEKTCPGSLGFIF